MVASRRSAWPIAAAQHALARGYEKLPPSAFACWSLRYPALVTSCRSCPRAQSAPRKRSSVLAVVGLDIGVLGLVAAVLAVA